MHLFCGLSENLVKICDTFLIGPSYWLCQLLVFRIWRKKGRREKQGEPALQQTITVNGKQPIRANSKCTRCCLALLFDITDSVLLMYMYECLDARSPVGHKKRHINTSNFVVINTSKSNLLIQIFFTQ